MANIFNDKVTGKKAFVCIMTAKGDVQQNLAICNGNTVCASRSSVKPIQDIAEKFMSDYAAPRWLPGIA